MQTGQPTGFEGFDLQLGDRLRGERATLGKSLLDVQRELKIKASFVAAIENCDLSVFETPSFVAGYVRSYARYLGLDPEEIFAQFCRESGFAPVNGAGLGGGALRAAAGNGARASEGGTRDPFAEANARFMPRGESALAHIEFGAIGSLMAVLALIGGLGYGAWAILREVQRVPVATVETGALPSVPQLAQAAQAPSVAPLLPQGVIGAATAEGAATPALASSEVLMERLYRPQALDMPVLISRDGPIAAIDPAKTGALARFAATAAAVPSTRPVAEDVQVSAPEAPGVALVAARPAWVRVSAADGTILFEKTLDAGERYVVPQMEVPALLRAGNSSAIYFLVNGETFGPAAPGPEVVKDVPLSAQALRLAYTPADPATDADLAKAVALAEAVSYGAGEAALPTDAAPASP